MKRNFDDPFAEDTREYDTVRRLQRLERREIFLMSDINAELVRDIIEDIRYLENKDNKREITIFINSPGGHVGDGFALIDAMLNCKCPIRTIALGEVASMACPIFIVGTKGLRLIGKNAWIMFHPITTGMKEDYVKFQKSSILQAEAVEAQYDKLILSHTEIPKEEYNKAKSSEFWIPAAKVLEYKIADGYYNG